MGGNRDRSECSLDSLQCKLYVPGLIFGVLGILIVSVMPWIGKVGMAASSVDTPLSKWVSFLGEFHPLFLHLPIGVLVLVIVMEVLSIVTFGRYKPNTTLALFFASVTGIFAAVFGYCLYLTGEFTGDLIEEHKRDGILFSVAVLVAFILKLSLDVRGGVRFLKLGYFVTLLLSGILMMSAGHHGGEITHGDPLDKAPWKADAEDSKKISKDVGIKGMMDFVVYKDIVHPILEAKCIECHKESKKKGGLRMDSYEFLLDGGEEVDCLVPGDLEESGMISYLHLPIDDDLHMPPENKEQMTAEEIQVLEWWVKIGAPEKAKLSEVELTAEIEKALTGLE